MEQNSIFLDIDRDRIRDIVKESLRVIREFVDGDFIKDDDQILGLVNSMLSTNRVSNQFFINVGSVKIPDLMLRVDLAKKRVLCKSTMVKKAADINHVLRVL